MEYGGFWHRFGALFIDEMVLILAGSAFNASGILSAISSRKIKAGKFNRNRRERVGELVRLYLGGSAI